MVDFPDSAQVILNIKVIFIIHLLKSILAILLLPLSLTIALLQLQVPQLNFINYSIQLLLLRTLPLLQLLILLIQLLNYLFLEYNLAALKLTLVKYTFTQTCVQVLNSK